MAGFVQKLGNNDEESQKAVTRDLKLYVSMKYLILIGFKSDFDTEEFRKFLSHLINLGGGSNKPFKLYLYNFSGEILAAEYPYLTLEGTAKKWLALYPNILLKSRDLDSTDKEQFSLYVGPLAGKGIQADQIEALGIDRVVMIWDKSAS